jgi:molybdopterin converting factor small subunit
MRVTVRLFARLRDLVGEGELVRDLPAKSTVATAWERLVTEFPAIAPRCRARSTRTMRDCLPRSTTVTRSRFCPPSRADSSRNRRM